MVQQQEHGRNPVLVVVHRRIKEGRERDYEDAMQEFIAFAVSSPGHEGIQLVKSDKGPRDYSVINKFRSTADRRAFTQSAAYQSWMERLNDLTEGNPHISELSGLETWFTPAGQTLLAKPPKWKMAVLTFIGVYAMTVAVALTIGPWIGNWHLLIRNGVVAALVVGALTWAVMPVITRLTHRWLFPNGSG